MSKQKRKICFHLGEEKESPFLPEGPRLETSWKKLGCSPERVTLFRRADTARFQKEEKSPLLYFQSPARHGYPRKKKSLIRGPAEEGKWENSNGSKDGGGKGIVVPSPRRRRKGGVSAKTKKSSKDLKKRQNPNKKKKRPSTFQKTSANGKRKEIQGTFLQRRGENTRGKKEKSCGVKEKERKKNPIP